MIMQANNLPLENFNKEHALVVKGKEIWLKQDIKTRQVAISKFETEVTKTEKNLNRNLFYCRYNQSTHSFIENEKKTTSYLSDKLKEKYKKDYIVHQLIPQFSKEILGDDINVEEREALEKFIFYKTGLSSDKYKKFADKIKKTASLEMKKSSATNIDLIEPKIEESKIVDKKNNYNIISSTFIQFFSSIKNILTRIINWIKNRF